MKITIQGQNYTQALDAAHPLTIQRRLNEPSVCRFWLSLSANGSLPTPIRNQQVAIQGDDGTYYFTGYLAASPLPEYAGMALEGPRSRIVIEAISDELLLDQLPLTASASAVGETAGALMTTLVTRTGSTALSTAGLTLSTPVNSFATQHGAVWSKSAGAAANQVRATYRVVDGELSLASIPAAVHVLDESSGTLNLAQLAFTAGARRALANDMTVCGEHEPVAYVTEYFLGDGVTTQFYLAENPYLPPSAKETSIHELFNESAIDPRLWANSGSAGYIELGAGGLAMNGGHGTDGDTMLTWLDRIEMGGTLMLEATGVTLATGSTGILPGFFTGLMTLAGCTAGFQATAEADTGAVTLQPVVLGTPTGSTFAVNPAHQYALRIRVHCPEAHRSLAAYRSFDGANSISYGGAWNSAPAKLLFEVQEFVDGVAAMPVVLLDGAIDSLPGSCAVAAVNSLNLHGSMRSLSLYDLGSGWVTTTLAGGSPATRRVGAAVHSAECQVERGGRLVFFTGFTPPAGELIAVSYRTTGRAVGRAVNADSQAALAAAGLPSVSAWIGSVKSPVARCSQDCRNAATALADAAASAGALWKGAYKTIRPMLDADVWPGDALSLQASTPSLQAQMIVRSVKLSYRASYPDLIEYAIDFANDWADDLAIQSSETVPADTWLPAPIGLTPLANLNALAVASISGSTVTVYAGATPPAGGGFEVRRRDFAFMPGEDADLVMRAAEPTMSFTRIAASDRFYIRMYDGATPPNYSEFSTALIFNLPLGF